MVEKIKSHSLGKLEISIEPSHKVRHGERTLNTGTLIKPLI